MLSKSDVFYDRYERKAELQHQTHYCPGCGHGIAHKLLAEAIHDLGAKDSTIFVSPVGCSVFAYYYFDVGNVQAAHGRTPAVATALKRSCPGSLVIGYQGDGDLAAIGTAEILHAANRGEAISIFFVNNAIYGMTGGQMAPTTLVGQTSTTTPWGRRPANEGYPIHVAELLATLEAPAYIERVSLHDGKNIMKARKAIRKALDIQRAGAGFTFVEILSPCPTIWKMTPVEAQRWVEEKLLPVFPLGILRDRRPAIAADGGPPRKPMAEVLGLTRDAAGAIPASGAGAAVQPVTVKVAGFGGQGVLLLGQMLAEIGLREGMEVSWLPSYGPEMRSGSAHCHVCIAGERIGSPLISNPDVLIAMNELSLRKFAPHVRAGGLILYNQDALPAGFDAAAARVVCVPASRIADDLGAARAANAVLLGALQAETATFGAEVALSVLVAAIRNPSLHELNRKAFQAGRSFAAERTAAA
ncbi:MAG: 2-oxoacid:acceptor oxidoreductase family protein [Acidobacteria bacterium]|nr:2-oxoacid:acceptor oxidoreductase family protein [Acidobacteriota bacterium]